MKISVISFTETGQQLAERIRESMDGETAVTLYTKCSRLEKKTVPAVDDSDANAEERARKVEESYQKARSIIYTSFPLINYIVHIHRDAYLLQGLQA